MPCCLTSNLLFVAGARAGLVGWGQCGFAVEPSGYAVLGQGTVVVVVVVAPKP